MEKQMIIVGGVPGSGKSSALAEYLGTPGIVVLDPDRVRDQLHWRPLVHLVHQGVAWAMILLGPGVVRRTVILHETATRARRRESMLSWAVRRGWRSSLLMIEVDRREALAGQVARGRMVPEHEFERHWARWQQLHRDGLQVADIPPGSIGDHDHDHDLDQANEPGLGLGECDVNGRDTVHREFVSRRTIRHALHRAVHGVAASMPAG